MAAISLRGIQKTFGGNAPVLRDLNLEIGEHELCVFLGCQLFERKRDALFAHTR